MSPQPIALRNVRLLARFGARRRAPIVTTRRQPTARRSLAARPALAGFARALTVSSAADGRPTWNWPTSAASWAVSFDIVRLAAVDCSAAAAFCCVA